MKIRKRKIHGAFQAQIWWLTALEGLPQRCSIPPAGVAQRWGVLIPWGSDNILQSLLFSLTT